MMQENLKLYPDMSLPTDKETELQAKIETLQSRLSMAEHILGSDPFTIFLRNFELLETCKLGIHYI